jgi:hypothetical protein
MSTERLLTTVLDAYQDVHDAAKTEQIWGSTTALLTKLNNPLNLSVLTSNFLVAPAIWERADDLRTCLRVVSVFNTGAIHVRRDGSPLAVDAWARAVAKGADERSRRWQHVLVLAGLLVGLDGGNGQSISSGLRHNLQRAVVTAANLALDNCGQDGPLAARAVVLGLNIALPLLPESSGALINCDALLPIAVEAMTGNDGFENGDILCEIGGDSRLVGNQLHWTTLAPSYSRLQQFEAKPLVTGAGPLSKLIAFAIHHARDSRAVQAVLDAVYEFALRLDEGWSTSVNLSSFDISLETAFLTPETRETTWPTLWQSLRRVLFATTVVLQAVLSRTLIDPAMKTDFAAISTAIKTLRSLRHLCFISSRQGAGTFQAYTFTYLTCIDILGGHPTAAASFLRGIVGQPSPQIPTDGRQLVSDLFYLNLAEHFALTLLPDDCDAMIIRPSMAYLSPVDHFAGTPAASPQMIELFEAAHSCVLSVLSCPNNAPVTVGLAPTYAEQLLASFPARISPRQFRLAFKTLMQVLSPPFPVSSTHPELVETLLMMVYLRVPSAATISIPAAVDALGQATVGTAPAMVSEQSTLVLTLIDALPFLPLRILEEWMWIAARSVWEVAGLAMQEVAKKRFWEVLVSGEMDVERAAIGVEWWGTKGGGDLVLNGLTSQQSELPLMSGAIPSAAETQDTSRL